MSELVIEHGCAGDGLFISGYWSTVVDPPEKLPYLESRLLNEADAIQGAKFIPETREDRAVLAALLRGALVS